MSPEDNDEEEDPPEDTGLQDEDEEEDTELPQPEDNENQDDETGTPPGTGYTFSPDFIKKLEAATDATTLSSHYNHLERILEQHSEMQRKILKAATSNDINLDLDQFKISLPPEIFGITKETNRALAESINPEIFRINKDIENAAATNLYENIAALNQIAQQGAAQPGTIPEPGETDEPTVGEIFEEEVIDEVAEEIVENDDYPSELKERAYTIRETDSHEEKQATFNQIYEIAEDHVLAMIELTVATVMYARLYAILLYLHAKARLTWNGSDD